MILPVFVALHSFDLLVRVEDSRFNQHQRLLLGGKACDYQFADSVAYSIPSNCSDGE